MKFIVQEYTTADKKQTWYQVIATEAPPREFCRCAREVDAKLIASVLNDL